jgi:hypothetical protein
MSETVPQIDQSATATSATRFLILGTLGILARLDDPYLDKQHEQDTEDASEVIGQAGGHGWAVPGAVVLNGFAILRPGP